MERDYVNASNELALRGDREGGMRQGKGHFILKGPWRAEFWPTAHVND